MGALILQNLLHLMRSRVLVLALGLSCVVQYFAVKLVHALANHIDDTFQGQMAPFSGGETFFVAILVCGFGGFFLAVVYGIWLAPYLHRGHRAGLTHVLPLSRWAFPASHGVSFLPMALIQVAALMLALGFNLGWGTFFSAATPWKGMLTALGVTLWTWYGVFYGAAALSLWFGPLPALFLCFSGVTLANVARMVFSVTRLAEAQEFQGEALGAISGWQRFYQWLPPLGEFPWEIRVSLLQGVNGRYLGLWALWIALFVVSFRWRLRFPQRIRSSEG